MSSSNLTLAFWGGYQLIIVVIMIWSAILFSKHRCAATRMILIGGIIASLASINTICWYLSSILSTWDYHNFLGGTFSQILGIGGALGLIIFHVGLLLFAKRLLRQSDRVADLEAILEDKMSTPEN